MTHNYVISFVENPAPNIVSGMNLAISVLRIKNIAFVFSKVVPVGIGT